MSPALRRILAGLGLASALSLGLAADARAQAQPTTPPAEGGEESDNSLYAYIGTGLFGAAMIFALCKSSRR